MDSIPFHIVALLGSVVGFIGLLVAVQFSAHRKARRTWLEFAEDHDLDFEADGLQMTGMFRGVHVSARTHTSFLGSGVFQASTRIEAKLPDSFVVPLRTRHELESYFQHIADFVERLQTSESGRSASTHQRAASGMRG
jgi:hypothetical protein